MSPKPETNEGESLIAASCSGDLCVPSSHHLTKEEAHHAAQSLRQMLRFETVSVTAPASGEYTKCANFLMEELGNVPCLDCVQILEEKTVSPAVVARWKSSEEDADIMPIILSNSQFLLSKVDWKMEKFTVVVFKI